MTSRVGEPGWAAAPVDSSRVASYLASGTAHLEDSRGWRRQHRLLSLVAQLIRRVLLGRAQPNRLRALVDSGQVTFGRFSYGAPLVDVYEGETTRVHIGSFCSIARDVTIFVGGNHRPDWVSTFPFRWFFAMPGANQDGHPATRGEVIIGNDVWIGVGATIMSGVRLGDGAVIGAEAVVTHDVRPYAVVVGVPAREVRRRFPDDQVDALLRIAWWDWPDEQVIEAVGELSDTNVAAFIARHHVGGG
ncbi:MAG: CatB-related O-acetyltransferase [Dehalococcoidia bacterium]|nr:CatB-related O-acetyltransferase [Dehalococcoidia bacterium]